MSTPSDRKASRIDELVEHAPEIPAVKPALVYIGNGAALPDVPARDLAVDEIGPLADTVGKTMMGHGGEKSFTALLIESGLYKEA